MCSQSCQNTEINKSVKYNIYSENDSIIAKTLVPVPMMSANKPNTPINIFFAIITVRGVPVFPFKNTSVSINAGNARPSVLRHSAPNNEINRSSFGMATASKTEKWRNDFFFNV